MNDERGRQRQRIGPWRLLDIVTATMPLRSGSFASAAIAPEYGPPDSVGRVEAVIELPDSNLHPDEQQQALRREAARRGLQRELT